MSIKIIESAECDYCANSIEPVLNEMFLKVETLEDQMKIALFVERSEKLSLSELQQRLK